MNSGVYKRRVDARDELLAHILDAAACIKECEVGRDEQLASFAHEEEG